MWPVASNWDDQYFFRLTRDGKRAVGQTAAALCNSKSTGFALSSCRHFLLIQEASSSVVFHPKLCSTLHSMTSCVYLTRNPMTWTTENIHKQSTLPLLWWALSLWKLILIKLLWLCLSKGRAVWRLIRLAEHLEPWVHSGDLYRQLLSRTKSTLFLWRGALDVTFQKAEAGSGSEVTNCDSMNGAAHCHFLDRQNQIIFFYPFPTILGFQSKSVKQLVTTWAILG